MRLYHATPHDTLFFRDARPMTFDGGSGGHGARWPEPSLIFDAIHAALHRAFPRGDFILADTWQQWHRLGRSSDRNHERQCTQRFGSLTSAGVFPALGGILSPKWLFPCPGDVTLAREGEVCQTLLPVQSDASQLSDLPAPLRYALGNPSPPSKKKTPPSWWSRAAWKEYLDGKPLPKDSLFKNECLFSGEWSTGIGIDFETGTQDGTHIYSAEYLRLRKEVGFGFAATLPERLGRPDDDCLDKLFEESQTVVVGGQRRGCTVESIKGSSLVDLLPVSSSVAGPFVKWVLLTPTVFPAIYDRDASGAQKHDRRGRPLAPHPGGWLPNWVRLRGAFMGGEFEPLADPANGLVSLLKGAGRAKAARRGVPEGTPIAARLVAARIPKPVVLTGWKERLHLADELAGEQGGHKAGPSSTCLAVPAGAVYYFEAEGASEEEKLANARALVDALSWHGALNAPDFGGAIKNRRSTLLGEKGFGLGVCGTWQF